MVSSGTAMADIYLDACWRSLITMNVVHQANPSVFARQTGTENRGTWAGCGVILSPSSSETAAGNDDGVDNDLGI